jgi:hypothetical protein
MTITTRAAKGAPLTNAELDANFTDLRDLKAPLDSPSFTSGVSVAGRINVTNDEPYILRIRRTIGSGSYYLGASSGAGNQALLFSSEDTAERMRLTGNGNLLIGTATDNGTSKLQVNGNVSSGAITVNTGAGTVRGITLIGATQNQGTIGFGITNDSYRISAGSDYGGMKFDSGTTLLFNTLEAERMRLTSNGNLLVSTATDDGLNRLQVNGSGVIAGNFGINTASYTQSSALQLGRVFSFAHDINSGYMGAGWFGTNAGSATYAVTGNFAVRTHFDSAVGNMLWLNAAAGTAGNAVTFVERMRLTSGGNLLLATSTDNGTDKLQVAGSVATSGDTTMSLNSTTSGPRIFVHNRGLNTTDNNAYPAGSFWASGFRDVLNPAFIGGIEFHRTPTSGGLSSAGTIRFFTTDVNDSLANMRATAEKMRLDPSGNLLVGATSGSNHTIVKAGLSEGQIVLGVNGTGFNTAIFYKVGADGFNAAATALAVGKNTGGRSINAGGTINASGADYAEYMTKADNVADLAKGDVVGVTADGELTDKWLDAVAFMVKSTDPSYVGGDRWGIGLEGGELEAARAKVDRIAFAGQVPVNVYGAVPGQYIVPVQDGAGITGSAVNADDMTMPTYLRAVGIVQNILPDGRANVRVKVA